MSNGITFITKTEESLNDIPFKLVEIGDIAFVNTVIAEELHKGYEPVGVTCDNGIWYLLVRKKVGIAFEYL